MSDDLRILVCDFQIDKLEFICYLACPREAALACQRTCLPSPKRLRAGRFGEQVGEGWCLPCAL
jgi:hypothetical protein